MMSLKRSVVGACLCGVLSAFWLPSVSQHALAAEVRVLTLQDALSLAKSRNRTLKVERTRVAQARTGIEQAWSALFPTVAAQGRYAHNYKEFQLAFGPDPLLIQPANQLDASISFNAPLLVPAAYPALESVKSGIRAAEAGYEVSEAHLLLMVAHAFATAALADEVVKAWESSLTVVAATLDNATTRFSAGTVTKVDVARAELAVVKARQAEKEARTGRDRAYRALATLLQVDEAIELSVQMVEPQRHDAKDLDTALKIRPELRALEASIDSLSEQKSAHKWRWAPTLSAFGNARRFNYENFVRDRHSWVVGAQLDWVLFDGGYRDAQRHLVEAQLEESRGRIDVLRETVRDDLINGSRQLETKVAGLQAAESAVGLAQLTLELVRVQYEAGSVTQVDLLSAQDALVASQVSVAQAHFELAVADLSLRYAAGTFPSRN